MDKDNCLSLSLVKLNHFDNPSLSHLVEENKGVVIIMFHKVHEKYSYSKYRYSLLQCHGCVITLHVQCA